MMPQAPTVEHTRGWRPDSCTPCAFDQRQSGPAGIQAATAARNSESYRSENESDHDGGGDETAAVIMSSRASIAVNDAEHAFLIGAGLREMPPAAGEHVEEACEQPPRDPR